MFVLVTFLRHDLTKQPNYCRLVKSDQLNRDLTNLLRSRGAIVKFKNKRKTKTKMRTKA